MTPPRTFQRARASGREPWAYLGCRIRLLPVSSGAIRRDRCGPGALPQRHERALLDAAAEVLGLGVSHDRTRVAERLQIAGDDFVEQCSFRAGDLNDAFSRRR